MFSKTDGKGIEKISSTNKNIGFFGDGYKGWKNKKCQL